MDPESNKPSDDEASQISEHAADEAPPPSPAPDPPTATPPETAEGAKSASPAAAKPVKKKKRKRPAAQPDAAATGPAGKAQRFPSWLVILIGAAIVAENADEASIRVKLSEVRAGHRGQLVELIASGSVPFGVGLWLR